MAARLLPCIWHDARGKSLVYVGKIGSGFSRKIARELHQILAPLAIDKPTLATPVRDAKTNVDRGRARGHDNVVPSLHQWGARSYPICQCKGLAKPRLRC